LKRPAAKRTVPEEPKATTRRKVTDVSEQTSSDSEAGADGPKEEGETIEGEEVEEEEKTEE